MSLVTPTVADINANIIAQIEATINQTIPLVPKAFIRVLAKVLAAVFVLLWKYGGFIFLQVFVRTATIENVEINGVIVSPLKEWGRLVGAGDPTAARQAELAIDITVETQSGSLPSGTPLINSATGVTYVLVGSVPLDAPTVQGTIRAAGDQGGGNGSGAIGNAADGDTISFVNTVAQVARDATVLSTVVQGANTEDTEIYRQRIIDRFAARPQGGALIDYKIWGEEVAGIVNIFPYTGVLPGDVDVFAEATVESSGSSDGFPTQVQLDAVAASIALNENGLASRRPANAFVNTSSITRTGFDVVVIGIDNVDNLSTVQTQIITAVTEYFLGREPFVSGVTVPPRLDAISNTAIAAVVLDIVAAANGTFLGISFALSSGGGNLFTYTLGQGEKSKLVTLVFQS